MKINQCGSALTVSDELANIIQYEIDRSKVDASNGVVVSFRDPEYSAKTGGFHPVEIAVHSNGCLVYITDFSYAGTPPFEELVKELDFDFELKVIQQLNREYPLNQRSGLFDLWQENFVSYYGMGVYQVTVGALL